MYFSILGFFFSQFKFAQLTPKVDVVDVYIFWVLGGFFSGARVGAYGPNFLTRFMTENMMEVVSVVFYNMAE